MVILAATATAQDRAAGPWWPHPLWGAEDQAGGSNWITPDKILQAAQLVTTGKLYEFDQVYEADMPIFGNRTYGLHQLGVEHIKPIFTRGILIDIASEKGVDALDHSYEVTVADVPAALTRQGMSEDDLLAGDAIFFRYGWSIHWRDHDKYNTNPLGIGLEVAAWLVEHQPPMIGSDHWSTEVIPNPDTTLAYTVHQQGRYLES
jgi:hypothetical protein